MSEIADVFKSLPARFQAGSVKQPRTFYFSLGDEEKWTVAFTPERCDVKPGKPEKDADCFFKASEQMFLDVWNGKHTPGPKDFLTGSIKSNNPLMLREFVGAFKKA
jgi:putative sterol carrier protein